MKRLRLLAALALCAISYNSKANAQSVAPPGAPAPKIVCSVDKQPVSPAEAALAREEYDHAIELFRAMAADAPDVSRAGVIRTLLGQDKVKEASDLAQAWVKEQPESAFAAETLAETLFRYGKPVDSYRSVQRAMALNKCLPRSYLMYSAFEDVTANFAYSKRHIDTAHNLAPNDPDIRWAWIATLPAKRQLEEREAVLKEDLILNAKDKARLTESIAHGGESRKDDCSVTTPVESAKIPIQQLLDGPDRVTGLALDVFFNNKRRRLEIDTGASGLILSRGAASGLGLVREQKITSGGVGDKGEVATSIAHVESVRIGNLEFHHCAVEILEKRSALDIDGLIGGNVFSKYLLTLDYPRKELRLDPLPKRPDEKTAPTPALNTAENRSPTPGAESGDSEEPTFHDRYIAPEMKDWTPVYRVGDDLLIPMKIGEATEKLFLVDTGAGLMSISPAAAREVTKVHGGSGEGVRGISGEVEKVYETGKLTISFAHLAQHVDRMTAFDTTKISHSDGLEVSGFLGSPILFRLTVHIDYRDNLMKFDYDPKVDHMP